MFIKRHIDEDADDAEIDKRCGPMAHAHAILLFVSAPTSTAIHVARCVLVAHIATSAALRDATESLVLAVRPTSWQSAQVLLHARRHRVTAARVRRYTDYLATFYKSRNKAAFERQKHEDAFKRKYDPFMFKEEVAQRSKTAQTTAVTVRMSFFTRFGFELCGLQSLQTMLRIDVIADKGWKRAVWQEHGGGQIRLDGRGQAAAAAAVGVQKGVRCQDAVSRHLVAAGGHLVLLEGRAAAHYQDGRGEERAAGLFRVDRGRKGGAGHQSAGAGQGRGRRRRRRG